jgi:hypothetical protein
VQSIPLLKQIWPVKLSELEEEIFERDFKKCMNKRQFKRFISCFRLRQYDAAGSQLCCIRSNFEYLVYIAKMNPGWKVSVTKDTDSSITELQEGSWIGTIEYVFDLERMPGSPMTRWGITANLLEENKINNEKHDQNNIGTMQPFTNRQHDASCLVYLVDIDVSIFILF